MMGPHCLAIILSLNSAMHGGLWGPHFGLFSFCGLRLGKKGARGLGAYLGFMMALRWPKMVQNDHEMVHNVPKMAPR